MTLAIAITALVLLLTAIFIVGYHSMKGNRDYFLNHLRENQTVLYGEHKRKGKIVSVYTTRCYISDMENGFYGLVKMEDIYPCS